MSRRKYRMGESQPRSSIFTDPDDIHEAILRGMVGRWCAGWEFKPLAAFLPGYLAILEGRKNWKKFLKGVEAVKPFLRPESPDVGDLRAIEKWAKGKL
jgi:hypothetical protein